jgi:hypothetical protein
VESVVENKCLAPCRNACLLPLAQHLPPVRTNLARSAPPRPTRSCRRRHRVHIPPSSTFHSFSPRRHISILLAPLARSIGTSSHGVSLQPHQNTPFRRSPGPLPHSFVRISRAQPCLCPHFTPSLHPSVSSRPFSPCISTRAWWSLHLSNLLFLASCPSTARPRLHEWLACPPECRLCNTRDRASTSTVLSCSRRRCLSPTLQTPHTLPRTPPRAPKPAGLSLAFAHIPRAQLPALAHDLRRSSTHTLPHPRAPGHRVSKSGRVRGEPRSGFTSRRACDVTHDPDIPVRTHVVLQHHPLPRNARPREAHAPVSDADLLSAAPLSLTRLTLLADTLPFAFSKVPCAQPADRPPRPPELRRRTARRKCSDVPSSTSLR